jgi:hypothetical protein
MHYRNLGIAFVLCAGIGFFSFFRMSAVRAATTPSTRKTVSQDAADKFVEGRHVFRFDTFGDQAFWGDALKLHKAIEGSKLGGVGPGVSPNTALAVGLKVDVDALPTSLIQELKNGQVNLNDPAVTLALLKLNSVLGVTGFFKSDGTLRSMGIQCAL